jgi:acyl dehydratase
MVAGNFNLANAEQHVGKQIGLSEWLVIGQELVDSFAQVTGDAQWIHVDGPQAYSGPFGGPVAHGLLVLSLTTKMAQDSGAFPADARSIVLYGYDRIRFQAPVRSGKRVRCRSTLIEVKSRGARVLLKIRFEVEVEGGDLLAMSADCLLLALP